MIANNRKYKNSVPDSVNEVLVAKLEGILKVNKDPSVKKKLQECLNLVVGLENYLDTTAAEETPVQKRILADTYSLDFERLQNQGKIQGYGGSMMTSGHLEGQFLRIVSQMTRAKRILEIGTFTGNGAVSLAQSDHCEEVVCLEYEPFYKEFVHERIAGTSLEKKIKVVVGPALDSLKVLKQQGKVFDLVFVDADKSNYINYYNYIMDNGLLEETGTFLIDNTLWKLETCTTPSHPAAKALHAFNEHICQDKRVNQVILPVNDGVTLIHRREASPV